MLLWEDMLLRDLLLVIKKLLQAVVQTYKVLQIWLIGQQEHLVCLDSPIQVTSLLILMKQVKNIMQQSMLRSNQS